MITVQRSATETARDSVAGGDTLSILSESIIIDATISESTEIGATATEHAVEDGAAITDHVHPSLRRISLECIVSNIIIDSSLIMGAVVAPNPLKLPAKREILKGAAGRIFGPPEKSVSQLMPQGGAIAAQLLTIPKEVDRVKENISKLEELVLSGTRVDILGLRLGDLYDWLIVGMSPLIENDDSVTFALDCQEIRVATVARVAAPSPQVERGRRQASRGRRPGTTGGDNQDREQRRSAAFELFNGTLAPALDLPQLRLF